MSWLRGGDYTASEKDEEEREHTVEGLSEEREESKDVKGKEADGMDRGGEVSGRRSTAMYGRRWAAEGFFSGVKRVMGEGGSASKRAVGRGEREVLMNEVLFSNLLVGGGHPTKIRWEQEKRRGSVDDRPSPVGIMQPSNRCQMYISLILDHSLH